MEGMTKDIFEACLDFALGECGRHSLSILIS